jgi:hypothetical protein
MDEEHTNNTLLIERYLQGKMSAGEAAEFEEHFLSSADLLDELESAERLQQGLKDVATLENAHTPAINKFSEKLATNLESLFQSPRYAMAASFLLVVSLGFSSFLFQQNARLGEIDPGLALPTEIIPMVSVRGITSGEPINTLHLDDTAQQFVLMLDPGYEDYTHLRATVFRLGSSGEPVQLWQLDHMLPGFDDMLALSLPSSILDPGDFEIHLEGWREEWPANHIFEPVRTIYFTCIDK